MNFEGKKVCEVNGLSVYEVVGDKKKFFIEDDGGRVISWSKENGASFAMFSDFRDHGVLIKILHDGEWRIYGTRTYICRLWKFWNSQEFHAVIDNSVFDDEYLIDMEFGGKRAVFDGAYSVPIVWTKENNEHFSEYKDICLSGNLVAIDRYGGGKWLVFDKITYKQFPGVKKIQPAG